MMQNDTKAARGMHHHFAGNKSTSKVIFLQTYIMYFRNGTVIILRKYGNYLRSRDAYTRKVMACHMLGDKLLPEPILTVS